MKKKMLSMALVLCMVVSLMPTVSLTARAAGAVIYLDGTGGDDSKDGTTDTTAVATLAQALVLCSDSESSTIVVCGKTTDSANTNINKKVTITSVINDTDYRTTNSAKLTFNGYSIRITLQKDVTFQNILIKGEYATVYAQGNKFTMGEDITYAVDNSTNKIPCFSEVFGGIYSPNSDSTSNITSYVSIASGYVGEVCGGSCGRDVSTSSNITVTGGIINNIYGGGAFGIGSGDLHQSSIGDTNINIIDGTVKSVYGGSSNGRVTGNETINISGGSVSIVSGMGWNTWESNACTINISGGKLGSVDCIIKEDWDFTSTPNKCTYTCGPINFLSSTGTIPIKSLSGASEVNIGTEAPASVMLTGRYNNLDNVDNLTINSGSSLYLKNSAELTGSLTSNGTLKLANNVCVTVDGTADGTTHLDICRYARLGQTVMELKSDHGGFSYNLVQTGQELAESSGIYTLTESPASYWVDDGNYDATLYGTLTGSDFSTLTTVDIATPAQLASVAKAVNDGKVTFAGKTVKLDSNVDLNGHLWEPVGVNEDAPFTGSFDGNGKTISNMDVEGAYSNAGLFGQVTNNTNPTSEVIKDVTVNGKISLIEYQYVGAIAGMATAEISGCATDVEINVSTEFVNDEYFVGGIVGSGQETAVVNCSNNGNIYADSSSAQSYVGGILGENYSANVINCYNTGTVTGNSSYSLCGGICGFCTDSINYDEATDSELTLKFSILNCYNSGSVSGKVCGGITGAAYMNSSSTSYTPIQNCYYLNATAANAYNFISSIYDDDGNIIENQSFSLTSDDGSMADSEMQAHDFLTTLNNWVSGNSTVSTTVFGSCSPIEWKQTLGVNSGYPIFTTDMRQGKQDQTAPTGLTGAAPTTSSNNDGKITGTTVLMEYKLASVADSAYTACSDGSTKAGAAGAYSVRFAAKTGYNAGTAATVIVPAYTQPSGSTNNTSSNTAIPVGIGGTEQSIGNVSNSTSGSVTTATVTADAGKLSGYISSASSGSSVAFTVPQSSGATVGKVDITLQTVGDMAQKSMTLDIKSGDTTYSVPATAVDTSAAAATLGASNLADVTFAVSIAPASTGDAAALTEAASSGGFEFVSHAVTFTVTATYNGKSTEIESFGAYVARTIKLDSSVDPSKITTAITVDADGSVRHIPTYVYKGTDGCYYAVVNSMTNSTYSIIYNVAEFADAKGTWYEAQADEMASRKILTGITEGTFGGDKAITRAEFAAVIVRALGLPQESASKFGDVSESSWCFGYVGAAYKTGIITGRSSTVFDPDANITREEAMAMIKRAAKVAGYKGTGSSVDTYSDINTASAWAFDAVSFNLANGLIVGSGGQIRPNETITRAQTATVVLRLLQKAKLIDIRSKV